MAVLRANHDLPSLLAAARLVITVNSTVAFDAMTLGIPALTVALPNNLSPLVDAGVMVGLAADEPIAPVIRELLYDEARRSALADATHAFVTRYDLKADGRAVERTADAILSLVNR